MVVTLELSIDGGTREGLLEGAKEVVEAVRPGWRSEELNYKVYTDGLTNQIVGVWAAERDDQLLVKVYGAKTEMFIDRSKEMQNIQTLHRAGCGPPLHASFQNGICYGFTKGVPITRQDATRDAVWPVVAREMARMHKIKEGDMTQPMLFPKMREFFTLLPDAMPRPAQHERLEELKYTKAELRAEMDEMESVVTSMAAPVVFCHSDLLLGNVIWDSANQSVGFIDYEYGGPNYQPFDIANHFNEYAGTEDVDYSLYPDATHQKRFIRAYLAHYRGIDQEKVRGSEVNEWFVMVNKFALTSHLFWGVWAIFQAVHSSIDFDFLEYGVLRLDEYRRRKDEFLSLKPDSNAEGN